MAQLLASTILALKLSLLIALPIAAVVIWQRRTRAHWSILLFGLAAFGFDYLLQSHLDLSTSRITETLALYPSLSFLLVSSWQGIYPPWILKTLILGLPRESIRWLLFRYAATKMRLWRDGVMFGITYSTTALLKIHQDHLSRQVTELDLYQNAFVEAMAALNEVYRWGHVLLHLWNWAVVLTLFNVCTSLLVLVSVQRRKIRYLLAAMGVYIVYANIPRVILQLTVGLQSAWLEPSWTTVVSLELARLPLTLLTVWLIFRMRKTFPASAEE